MRLKQVGEGLHGDRLGVWVGLHHFSFRHGHSSSIIDQQVNESTTLDARCSVLRLLPQHG